MCKIDKDLSLKLSRLSFIAATMVVLQHSYMPGMFGDILCKCVVLWDVPYFFAVAGLLLFKDYSEWDYGWFVKIFSRRIKTLLVPYVFWTIWGLVLGALAIWVGIRENTFRINDISWWISAMGVFEASMYAGHLWFVRRLFLFVLVSPLIPWLVKRIGWWLIPALLAMYLLGCKFAGVCLWFAFFYFGACCSLKSCSYFIRKKCAMPLTKNRGDMVFGLLLVYTCSVFACYFTLDASSELARRFWNLCVAVAGIAFFSSLYDRFPHKFSVFDWCGRYSFLIYCEHQSMCQFVKQPFRFLGGWGVILSCVTSLYTSILIADGFRRLLPGFYVAISGGRGASRVAHSNKETG